MQCVDVCVAAKAQCVPAESRVDDFMRHIEAGWHKWRSKQLKLVQPRKEQQAQQQPQEQQPREEEQQQPPPPQQSLLEHSQQQQGLQPQQQAQAQALQLEQADAAGATAAGQPEGKQQQQGNVPKHAAKPPGGLLLLGRYIDAQEWLVMQVLPGLERHAHLAGLLGLLRKWVSRKVEGVSGSGGG